MISRSYIIGKPPDNAKNRASRSQRRAVPVSPARDRCGRRDFRKQPASGFVGVVLRDEAALESGLEDRLFQTCSVRRLGLKNGTDCVDYRAFILSDKIDDRFLLVGRGQREFHNDESNLRQVSNVRRDPTLALETA
jgi:hypothetical protein